MVKGKDVSPDSGAFHTGEASSACVKGTVTYGAAAEKRKGKRSKVEQRALPWGHACVCGVGLGRAGWGDLR